MLFVLATKKKQKIRLSWVVVWNNRRDWNRSENKQYEINALSRSCLYLYVSNNHNNEKTF